MNKFLYKTLFSILTIVFLFVGVISAHAETYTSTIKTVVDGDTVHLNQPILGSTKVHLLSIDAPETDFHGKGQGEYATAAANYLTQLLPPGTQVTIELGKEEEDQYGRLLGHIYKGNLNINMEMVRKGHAVTYFIYPNLTHFIQFQNELAKAMDEGLGIWNPDNPLRELPFVFRARILNSKLSKWVGDSHTKEIFQPNEYEQVPDGRRVFFMSESEAKEAMQDLIDK